ncbi:MAG: LamG domain-containing protein [Candidatus Nanohaloarchaea archaeon]|nr:LamG domain-containing protein [Candidatus Nanohaloarchaea archaeon]
MESRSGVSALISLVIYTGIVVAAVGVVLNVGGPVLDRMQDTAAIQSSIDTLTGLDEQIRSVAAEGTYSSRTATLRFQRGQYRFDNETGELYYRIETGSNFISSHSAFQRGPVLISADADVSVTRSSVNGTNCYMMTNQYLEACIRALNQSFDASNYQQLVGLWQMDAGSGQYVNDTSQYGNTGTRGASSSGESSDPTWVDGRHEQGLEFDGSDDYVNVSGHVTEGPAVTVTAWVNTTAGGTRTAVSVGDYVLLQPVVNGGAGEAKFYDGSGYHTTSFSTAVNDAAWHHVAYVLRPAQDEQAVYVDGDLDTSTTYTANVSFDGDLAADTTIGANASGTSGNWKDEIDSVRVYNRSLTGQEVEWLALAEADLDYINTSELLVHYKNTKMGTDLDPTVEVKVNEKNATEVGTGYTTAERLGPNLGRGRVTATVNSDYGLDYDAHFDLLSGADFLKVEVNDQ